MVKADDFRPSRFPGTRRAALLESLEPRRLMHGDAGHDDGGDGDHGGDHDSTDGLDPAIVAEVRNNVLKGVDVSDRVGTDYDPHEIGVPTDDPRVLEPLQPSARPGDAALGQNALPDMIPWTGPSGSNYYYDTQIDTFSIPGRRLLRFSTAIANAGAGPVELRGGPLNADGTQQVLQRVYNYNPQTNQYTADHDQLAGNFIYHPGHNHLHFEGYAEYKLLTSDAGQPAGVAHRSDGTDVLGEKVGFCLINLATYNSSAPGYNSSPGGYGCGLLQGISVGRADIYTSSLDSQWIDVTGVPAGNYFIQVTLDANNAVQESNEDNNTIQVPVTISASGSTATGIQPDRFDNIALNNTFETATDFGELGDRTEASLTLHAGYDEDFYRFVATSTGPLRVTMPSSGGDPNLFFYDGDHQELARSTRSSGTETVNVNVVDGQAYFVRVNNFQYTDALVNNYSLLIDGPAPKVTPSFGVRAVDEGDSTVLRVRRNGPLTTPIIAPIVFAGTATKDQDYTVTTEVASFGAEANELSITITSLRDRATEGAEYIDVSLAPDASYVNGAIARLYIRDLNLGSSVSQFELVTPGLFRGGVGGGDERSIAPAVAPFNPGRAASVGTGLAGFASPFGDTPLSDTADDLLPDRYFVA